MIRSVGKTQSLQTIRGKASSSTQRGIRRRIPAGMTEKGLGVQKRKKTQRAVVCFVLLCFFPPPLQQHRTLLSFRVKLLHAAGWHSGDMECSVPPAEQWKNTSLCLPDLRHLQGEVLGMGTAGRTAGTRELWWPPAQCHCQPGQHVPCTKHATFPALPDPLPTWHN